MEAYEAEVVQVATSSWIFGAIASALKVKDHGIAPVARIVAAKVHKELSSLSQGSEMTTSLLPSLSHTNSSLSHSDDENNKCSKYHSHVLQTKGGLSNKR